MAETLALLESHSLFNPPQDFKGVLTDPREQTLRRFPNPQVRFSFQNILVICIGILPYRTRIYGSFPK